MKNGNVILSGLLVAAIGAAAGWFAARQETVAPDEGGAEESTELSAQTLKNLGVEVKKLTSGRFVRHRSVQAIVVDPTLNTRPLAAPFGGVVESIAVEPGAHAPAGTLVAKLLRDPIPRSVTDRVTEILAPVRESLHESLGTWRTARGEVSIVQRELSRVQGLNRDGELPVVSRQTLINLKYDLSRAQLRLDNALAELRWHGVTPEDGSAEHGHTTPRLWRQALKHNGLWNAVSDAVLAALPEATRKEPWTISIIGELMAAGLATEELAGAIAADPGLARRFAEAASLLVSGHSVASIRWLAAQGALEPVVHLEAPAGDWDVAAIDVRPGERVAPGARLVLLHDPSTMWLELHPAGDEIAFVAGALESGAAIAATPLLPGTGPALGDLRLQRLATRGDAEARGGSAYVVCPNEAIAGPDGFRSWKLRGGLRYVVNIPVETFEDRFVLPAGAVTEAGPDRIVFRLDGDTFQPVPVHVEYEDSEIVVIAQDGAVYAGEPIVVRGAFALNLALQTGGGSADPHAGHSHPH